MEPQRSESITAGLMSLLRSAWQTLRNELTLATSRPDSAPRSFRCLMCNSLIESGEPVTCRRCQTDNGAWVGQTFLVRLLEFPWLVWLALLALMIVSKMASMWLVVPALAILIYLSRSSLRLYELRRQHTPKSLRLSLVQWAIMLILLAAIGALAFVATRQWLEVGELSNWALWKLPDFSRYLRLFMIPATATAVMLFGVVGFIRKVDERFPRPIFCEVDQLQQVVLTAVRERYLGLGAAEEGQAEALALQEATQQSPAPLLDVVSIQQNYEGGLDMLLRLTRYENKSDLKTGERMWSPEQTSYELSTDRWGQIRGFKEQTKRSKVVAPTR